jgi:hypothetical protein
MEGRFAFEAGQITSAARRWPMSEPITLAVKTPKQADKPGVFSFLGRKAPAHEEELTPPLRIDLTIDEVALRRRRKIPADQTLLSLVWLRLVAGLLLRHLLMRLSFQASLLGGGARSKKRSTERESARSQQVTARESRIFDVAIIAFHGSPVRKLRLRNLPL